MIAVLIIHLFATLFMTGAIWLVQALVYPNFKIVGKAEFQKFHEFHTHRITWIVAPMMALELGTGAWLLAQSQSPLLWWNVGSILLIWTLTATVNVPSHKNLEFEFDDSKSILISGNWPRTAIWTVRSLFLLWLISELASGKKEWLYGSF